MPKRKENEAPRGEESLKITVFAKDDLKIYIAMRR